MGIVLTLFSTAALADNVLIVHDGYEQTAAKVGSRITNAGHTVTELNINDTAESTIDLSTYDQVWDLRYNPMATETIAKYDTFVDAGGFLYLVTENPGCCGARNTQVGTLISNMGGGDNLTIGGSAGMTSNTITQVNATYMTALGDSGSIDLAAASAIENYGDGQWLIKDANDKVAGVMWVGNAGNLADGYTGTVITIADINWFDNDNRFTDNNIQAVDDLLNGVVAGTVEGTISESGTGTGVGGGDNTPSEPTLVTSEAGEPVIVTTDTAGGNTTVTVESFTATETDTEQTLGKTTDTIVTTITNRETCTTPTTVETWSDGEERTVNGTETCTTEAISSSTTATATESFTGRIDQLATSQNVVSTQIRNLSFDGIQGVRQSHTYDNGMTGNTNGFTLGGELPILDNGLMIGGGLARLSTSLNGDDSASSSTLALQGSIGRAVAGGVGEVKVTRATTDYNWSRDIGPYSNAGSSKETDTSISGTYRHALNENITPIVGYTIGRRETDAWQESGFLFSRRSAEASSETYRYGTIGVEAEFEMLNLNALRHTDGVTVVGVGVGSSTEKFDWDIGVERTITDSGESTGVQAGIKIQF